VPMSEKGNFSQLKSIAPRGLAPALPKRILALDGLRGLAILLVLAFHIFSRERRGLPVLDWFFELLGAGWIGVDLFFVLSGFLITGILLESRGQAGYLTGFYGRRVLRIFPLYYGCAAVVFLVIARLPIPKPIGFYRLHAEQVWVWLYATNIFSSMTGLIGPSAGPIGFGHFWSLAVEEHFYLVWPIVVLAIPRRWIPIAVIAVTLLSLLARCWFVIVRHDPLSAYVLTPCRIDGLTIGGLCAVLLRDPVFFEVTIRLSKVIIVVAGIGLIALYTGTRLDFMARSVAIGGFTMLALFFAALLVVLATSAEGTLLRRTFECSTLRFFGKYSYGLYALHMFVMGLLIDNRAMGAAFARAFHSQTMGGWCLEVLTFLASVAAAYASWHLFEKHFLKLKRFLDLEHLTVPTTVAEIATSGVSIP